MTTPTNRYTLITNLDFVIIGVIRTYTNALLVERTPHILDNSATVYQLRGFLTDASLPTFTAWIPTDEYTLVDASSPHVFLSGGEDSKPQPLSSGAIMRIAGFPDVQLIRGSGSERELDVIRFPDETYITEVWSVLDRKVAEHWSFGNMPVATWRQPAAVRRMRGVR